MTENSHGERSSRHRPRLPIVMLALVFVLPVVLALYAYRTFDVAKVGTTNYGELVHPARPLQQVALTTMDGTPFTVAELRGKWTLVYILGSPCEELCAQAIYKMRQVRWSQGEEMHRVQRLLVVMDSQYVAELEPLLAEYPGLIVVTGSSQATEAFAAQFDQPDEEAARLANRTYIVDPIGNLMMSYSHDADAKGMLKDLKRLLHVSQVG